jgi:gamma-glutamylcyclotransferase (GGCT)/AIG2-like uncharacterized protein YtfP
MLYFAYGSNLHLRQFKRRCPTATQFRRARLPGYRLAFKRYSKARKGGVADVVEDPDAEVWGALYHVDKAALDALDRFEEVPHAYRRDTVRVCDDDGVEHEAYIYFANKTGDFAPSKQYLGLIVSGAKEHELPEDYVRALQEVRTYT